MLKLYNTATRQKDMFIPIDEKDVRMYVCGPTVYSFAHIGNARSAVVFDLLRRVLDILYNNVTIVRNITDIDDKIIVASQKTGQPISDITRTYEYHYNDDMGRLGVRIPTHTPRATEYIPQMIAMVEALIASGHAYEADGHVLFHVPSYDDYGALSRRPRDEQIAGARVEVASYKKDPADFVLWKPSKDDEPGWESPWGSNNGRGRPGWHLECSAMSKALLGDHFDIHGGGLDLIFPHHENEIAQSCCANGSKFANYWMHNGFVEVEGQKMSKSLGNVLLVHDLLKEHSGRALRLALLMAHYPKPLNWTANALGQAENMIAKWDRKLEGVEVSTADMKDNPVFIALCDDLNMPKALAAFNTLLKKDPPLAKQGLAVMGL